MMHGKSPVSSLYATCMCVFDEVKYKSYIESIPFVEQGPVDHLYLTVFNVDLNL